MENKVFLVKIPDIVKQAQSMQKALDLSLVKTCKRHSILV